MTGWHISGFTQVRSLGEGAQGSVVLARHDETGGPVAIKYLPPEADERHRERMVHEARMLGLVQSPHVARLYRLVQGEQGTAILMEAVAGASLKVVLERHGALGPEAALTVLKGSLLGLAAAHEVGVVHRDYKPANVVVPADGRSKLIDFGIATPEGDEAGGAGTPYYMAPEQWARHVATPATDVYAATCVFVECVTGERPFTGNRDALRAAHLNELVPVEGVPVPLRPLVARGMAKQAALRPSSAALFVDELERVAHETYGDGWEDRGIRKLAASAAALAALFPIAATMVAPGTAAVTTTTTTAATGGAQALIGSTAVKIAATVGGVVLAAGGVVAVQQFATRDEVKSAAGPTPTASRVALTPVSQCRVTDELNRDQTPKGTPASVRLPTQVKLPSGARIFQFAKDTRVIGPPGECSETSGHAFATSSVGRQRAGVVRLTRHYTISSQNSAICSYFPDSPQAAKLRGTPWACENTPAAITKLETGVPGLRAAFVATNVTGAETPPSSYTALLLALLTDKGASTELDCVMPWSKASICTAAFTYWFAESTAKRNVPKAQLDRVAKAIAAQVAASRR
ncbi:serine/threonine-protein kinase [Spirillospora sp. CA-294931]|uniref:serine/threonine-protein kinase n=1 Tax=Spirillospora sp. CA-294931 TaxID=3240042 RepID=UPI003D9152FC